MLITRLDPDVPLPSYARQDDAGADLVCAGDVDLAPGQRAVVGTGIAIALPPGTRRSCTRARGWPLGTG